MNFGLTVKNEILSKPIREEHCQKAFLAGVFRGGSALFYDDDGLGFVVSVSNENIAMLISSLLTSLYNYEIREMSVGEDKLNKKDKFSLYLSGEDARHILQDLDVIKEDDGEFSVNFNLFGEITEKECCLRSFFKGLFLSSGSCTVPSFDGNNSGYRLEIPFSRAETASSFTDKLLNYNIDFKVMRRKDTLVAYIKNAEQIKDFLAFLSAPVSVLKLTDLLIERGIVNDSNRRKNCDLGNVGRQIEAVEKQIFSINKIKDKCGLEILKKDLKTVATERLNNPEESVLELAERLNLSKSCVNHRLRKIAEIADGIDK